LRPEDDRAASRGGPACSRCFQPGMVGPGRQRPAILGTDLWSVNRLAGRPGPLRNGNCSFTAPAHRLLFLPCEGPIRHPLAHARADDPGGADRRVRPVHCAFLSCSRMARSSFAANRSLSRPSASLVRIRASSCPAGVLPASMSLSARGAAAASASVPGTLANKKAGEVALAGPDLRPPPPDQPAVLLLSSSPTLVSSLSGRPPPTSMKLRRSAPSVLRRRCA
jgi:hypothetical protein